MHKPHQGSVLVFRVGSALHPAKMRGDPIMLVDKMQSRVWLECAGTLIKCGHPHPRENKKARLSTAFYPERCVLSNCVSRLIYASKG